MRSGTTRPIWRICDVASPCTPEKAFVGIDTLQCPAPIAWTLIEITSFPGNLLSQSTLTTALNETQLDASKTKYSEQIYGVILWKAQWKTDVAQNKPPECRSFWSFANRSTLDAGLPSVVWAACLGPEAFHCQWPNAPCLEFGKNKQAVTSTLLLFKAHASSKPSAIDCFVCPQLGKQKFIRWNGKHGFVEARADLVQIFQIIFTA